MRGVDEGFDVVPNDACCWWRACVDVGEILVHVMLWGCERDAKQIKHLLGGKKGHS